MRVSIYRMGIVFLVVLSIALAFGTTTALAHKSKGNYMVDVEGVVNTTANANGDRSSFITTGNRNGTKIGGDAATTFLDLDDVSLSRLINHPSSGVCDIPTPLDNVNWNFRGISIGKTELVARFDLRYKNQCGFDDYTLRIVFKTYVVDENLDGSRVYTPDGSAGVAIIHYAENGKGKNKESHDELVGRVFTGNLTITVTPVH